MVDSVSGLASLATRMSVQQTALDANVAVLNKIQDQQEAEGEAVVKLIESTSAAKGGIDVYA
ncbi:YjfB family protein [Methylotuvimicrobium alcaliphilum]|uniref:Aspartate kinase n=1 Tax=Methylotuvimicrobium alcaliphilum (strain DSM 19304 / NCIMB 14124 / VKM B-2133 / 20Z) TaxID=1091494 RepID=G4SW19_META2|nr:YjfB family protein [Methylotuvimicrobium alcaliphilum]CCE21940.1 Aspartate kinase [Methylotuvimicrobium alcaliphilum 20Z]